MVGNVLASFPLNKSRAKEPLDEEPIPLVRRSVPPASLRIQSKGLGEDNTTEAVTKRKTILPPKEEVELVAPGMFRLPVSDDAKTLKVKTPGPRDAIPPQRLPAFDIESVDSFELVLDSEVAEEESASFPRRVPHDTPADWDDSSMATVELKSPEELRGESGDESCESIHSVDIVGVVEEDEELRSPEELRRSTRPPMTGEVPESQPLFSLIPGVAEERADGESSVNRSLKDLEEIELERQLTELEEEEKREAEAKRAEFLRVLTEKRKKMEAEQKAEEAAKKAAQAKAAAEAAARAAEEAKRAEEEKRAREGAAREAESEDTAEEIHVEIEAGILWEDEHTTYRLSDDEMAICEPALPNRKRRFILPVPDEDSEFAEIIKANLKDEDRVRLAGKSYYIMEREFAEAKIVARVGNTIHVWPSAATSYEFLGRIGVETPEYERVSWPKEFYLTIKPEEMEMVGSLIYENRPTMLHPVPEPYTKNAHNLKIMQQCNEVPIVDIGGKEYYVLEPETVSAWREIVLGLDDARMVSRNGEKVSVWDKKLNGRSLFSCEGTCHLSTYGQPGAPMLPRGHEGTIEPYNAEVIDISNAFRDGECRRHLYPMPEKVSEMDSSKLHSLMMIAAGYVEKEKHSPLISIRGRWYLALEYPGNGTREAEYKDGMVRVLKEKTAEDGLRVLAEMMQRKKEEREPPIVKLPMDPEQRVGLMNKFPEHKTMYLLQVDRDLESEVPDVWVKNGGGVARYLVYDKDMPGSFMVVRVGDEIRAQRK